MKTNEVYNKIILPARNTMHPDFHCYMHFLTFIDYSKKKSKKSFFLLIFRSWFYQTQLIIIKLIDPTKQTQFIIRICIDYFDGFIILCQRSGLHCYRESEFLNNQWWPLVNRIDIDIGSKTVISAKLKNPATWNTKLPGKLTELHEIFIGISRNWLLTREINHSHASILCL